MQIKTAFIIGSGNVAWLLGVTIKKIGIEVLGVYNKTQSNGEKLAKELKVPFYKELQNIPLNADIYFLCVSDAAINNVSKLLPKTNGLVVHNSGSVSINEISEKHLHRGVFYCLQTMKKTLPMDFSKSPILIQANSQEDEDLLFNLAKKLTENVRKTSDLERTKLHITAVFSCNFTNYLYAVAYEYAKENQIDFNLLIPLLAKTTMQITAETDPFLNQTGPAVRNDMAVIEKHLTLLKKDQEKHELYKFLTNSILNHKTNNNEEL